MFNTISHFINIRNNSSIELSEKSCVFHRVSFKLREISFWLVQFYSNSLYVWMLTTLILLNVVQVDEKYVEQNCDMLTNSHKQDQSYNSVYIFIDKRVFQFLVTQFTFLLLSQNFGSCIAYLEFDFNLQFFFFFILSLSLAATTVHCSSNADALANRPAFR